MVAILGRVAEGASSALLLPRIATGFWFLPEITSTRPLIREKARY